MARLKARRDHGAGSGTNSSVAAASMTAILTATGVYARLHLPHRRDVAGRCWRGSVVRGGQRLEVGTGTRICLPSSDGLRPALLLRIAYTRAGN